MSLGNTFGAYAGTIKPQGFEQHFWSAINNLGFMSQEQLNKKLQDAALEGNIQSVALWHKAGADVNANYSRAVKFSIHSGSEECVNYLIDKKAVPSMRVRRDPVTGSVPENFHPYDELPGIAVAGGHGRMNLIDLLATTTFSIGDPCDEYTQAFEWAIMRNKIDAVQHLLEKYKDKIHPKSIAEANRLNMTEEMKEFLKPHIEAANKKSASQYTRLDSGSPFLPPPGAPPVHGL